MQKNLSVESQKLYVVHCMDDKRSARTRRAFYSAHRRHLAKAAEHGVVIVMSGPLVDDEGNAPIGSLFIFGAANAELVRRFHYSDPFNVHGLWKQSSVSHFVRKR